MATLEDIAAEVGCSISTVSRALSHHPRINAATKRRVAEVAERLGYRGNALLRATLREQKTIGFVIPSIRNSHYYDDASLLHDVLSENGYKILLSCHRNDAEHDTAIMRSLLKHPVSGIIHIPCTANGWEDLIDDLTVPVVELGYRNPSTKSDVIFVDELGAMNELLRFLTRLGHRRIALLNGLRHLFHIQARSKHFQRAAVDEGLDPGECPIIHGPVNATWFRNELGPLLGSAKRPTALIATSKPSVVGALRATRDAGLSIPSEISLVSFTNEDWQEFASPPLTAYANPFGEMGMMAAQILRQRMEVRGEYADPRTIRFSGEIIERNSTAKAPRTSTRRGSTSVRG